MAIRSESVAQTRRELEEAFQRLKEGNPIRVEGAYRISPSKVEQEAGRSTGTIYQRPYSGLLFDVKSHKAVKIATERGLSGQVELLEQKLREKNRKLVEAKDRLRKAAKERAQLETAFKESIGDCEDIVSWLTKKLPDDVLADLQKLSSGHTEVVSNTNVVDLVKKMPNDSHDCR